MSRDGAAAGVDRDAPHRRGPWIGLVRDVADRERVVVGSGAVALLVVAARTGLRILHNVPFDPVAVPPAARALAAGATPGVLALGLIAVGVASDRPAVRVGLLFAGIFGGIAALDRTATLPAATAVTAGGGLALLGAAGRPTSYRDLRRRVVTLGAVAGVGVSLAGTTGIVDGSVRGAGTLLALGAVAAVAIRAEGDPVALACGPAACAGVAGAIVASPFVVGSALLVGFAVVGAPGALVAVAAGGATAAAVAGLRRRDWALAVGAALLLVAGAPTTVPRAMAVLFGAALALVGPARLAASPGNDREGVPA